MSIIRPSRRALISGATALAAMPARASMDKSYGIARGWPSGGGQLILTGAPYVGQVANQTMVPTASGPATYLRGISVHTLKTAVSTVNMEFGSFYGTGQLGNGASTTLTAGIEYPIGSGTFYQVKVGGSPNVTVPNGGKIAIDPISLSLPAGAKFALRKLAYNASGIICAISPGGLPPGEVAQLSSSALTDYTMGGATTGDSNTAGYNIYPVSITGATNVPTILIVGDSRAAGQADTSDASSDVGEIARSIGPNFAYINDSMPGRSVYNFINGGATNALALANDASAVIFQMSVNDFHQNNITLAGQQANIILAWSLFAPLPVYQTTVSPDTTSTDAFATSANQTIFRPNLVSYNAWLRDNAPISGGVAVATGTTGAGVLRAGDPGHPLAGVIDTAQFVESATTPGVWKGSPEISGAITGDGLHPNASGYQRIFAGNVLSVRVPPVGTRRQDGMDFTLTGVTYGTGAVGYGQERTAGYGVTNPSASPFRRGGQTFAMEGIVSMPTAPGAVNVFFGQSGIMWLGVNGSGRLLGNYGPFVGDSTNSVVGTNPIITDGSRHFIRLSISPTGAFLYCDGVLVASNATAPTNFIPTSNTFGFGILGGNTSYNPTGTIDEIAVFNTTLGAGIPTAPYLGTEPGLVGLWHFNSSGASGLN